MNPILRPQLSRRTFLRAGGVSLALPFLDLMEPLARADGDGVPPRRMVCICTALGLQPSLFFPKETGNNYSPSPYLDLLSEHRADFTVFSGLAHEGNETDGHNSEVTFLTAARNPQRPGFRNSISLDQFVADKIGILTRFPSLALANTTGHAQSLAVNRSGVNLPSESKPSKIFASLFLDGTVEEIQRETARLAEGRSILDTVADQAKRLGRSMGQSDRDKLDEYFTSVRETEARLHALQTWSSKPKPKVTAPPPTDVANTADQIAKINALFDLMPLALQTDSTRIVTMLIGDSNVPIPLAGVTMGHHALSHHGLVPEKMEQLRTIEEAEMRAFAKLLAKLKAAREGGVSLLDNTSVLLGSNLGNANSHSTRNLPILLAGGGFKHGRHLSMPPAGNGNHPAPLSNLFVTLAQRMGLETETFGASTGAMPLRSE